MDCWSPRIVILVTSGREDAHGELRQLTAMNNGAMKTATARGIRLRPWLGRSATDAREDTQEHDAEHETQRKRAKWIVLYVSKLTHVNLVDPLPQG
jgi:hypothetical protein